MCQRLHENLLGLNQAGVTLHYYFWPRVASNPSASDRAVAAAFKRHAPRTVRRRPEGRRQPAVRGQELTGEACAEHQDTPIAHYQFGQVFLDVSGTPTFLTPEGALIVGYGGPIDLLKDLRKAQVDAAR